ncbi:hypothetical protein [Gynuella sp.]|uniref:hypothetical protein n=1 Tax=Gynuella sp. TaxID=2969146 RepID=UPI003D0B5BD3
MNKSISERIIIDWRLLVLSIGDRPLARSVPGEKRRYVFLGYLHWQFWGNSGCDIHATAVWPVSRHKTAGPLGVSDVFAGDTPDTLQRYHWPFGQTP